MEKKGKGLLLDVFYVYLRYTLRVLAVLAIFNSEAFL